MITGKNIVNAGVMSGRSAQTLAPLAEGVGEAQRYERFRHVPCSCRHVSIFAVTLLSLGTGCKGIASLNVDVRVFCGAYRQADGWTYKWRNL